MGKTKIKINNTTENENLPKRGGFKKFLKGVGLFLLVIVAVFGVGAVGAWLSGSFNPEEIYIQSMSINGVKEFVDISGNDTSYTTKIDFLPANANQLALTPKIITGNELIEPLPAITAGENFEIKFTKDENGTTKGGEVEIKFVDCAPNSYVVLKLLIDVGMKSESIEIASNGNNLELKEPNVLSTNVLTTVTKSNANVIKINANYDNMLGSYKGNWSESVNNNLETISRLKKMLLFYNKEDVSVDILEAEDADGNPLGKYYNEVVGDDNYYTIKYLTPASSVKGNPFILDVYIYKTYNMENMFSETLATSLITALEKNSFDRESVDYVGLNSFINNYVYNNSNVDIKNNYDIFRNSANGLIELNPTKLTSQEDPNRRDKFKLAIKNAIDYALAGKRIEITVDNIEVKEIINLKGSESINFSVLTSRNYTTTDIRNELGISLTAVDDKADDVVLNNNMRQLDIFLAVKSSYGIYDPDNGHISGYLGDIGSIDADASLNDAEKLKKKGEVMNSYFKIKSDYYKKIDAETNSKFKIIKIDNPDGSRSWSLQALSPTVGTDNIFIMYKFDNEFESAVTVQVDSSKTDELYYKADTKTWHNGPNGNFNNLINLVNTIDGVSIAERKYEFSTLQKCFNYQIACSPINVTYTSGNIIYNQEKTNYTSTSTIVMNNEDTIYKNKNGIASKVHQGDDGLYYKSRPLTINTIINNQSDVIISSNIADSEMEYKYVKWFVKYEDNKYSVGEGDDEKIYYYIKPVVEGSWDTNIDGDGKHSNPVPKICYLKDISNNNYLMDGGDNIQFMEVGSNECSLEVLNAMAPDKTINLYAVIIQTDINNNPIIIEEAGGITYNYINFSDSHKINTTKFVEKMYFFNNEWERSVETKDGQSEIIKNYTEIREGEVGKLILSSFSNLGENGVPMVTGQETDWIETTINGSTIKNEKIMAGVINVVKNEEYAMQRFYNTFLQFIQIVSGKPASGWTCGQVNKDQNGNYQLNSYSISIASPTNSYIEVNINNISTGTIDESDRNGCPFVLVIDTTGNSSGTFFTQIKVSDGYFKLIKAEPAS